MIFTTLGRLIASFILIIGILMTSLGYFLPDLLTPETPTDFDFISIAISAQLIIGGIICILFGTILGIFTDISVSISKSSNRSLE